MENFTFSVVVLNEISENFKKSFLGGKPPILTLEVGFFSDRKRFSQIFENWIFFFHLNFISIKRKKKSENIFWSGGHYYGELRPSFESALQQNTPDYEISSWIFFLQVGFFSTLRKLAIFFSPELYFYKKRKKTEKLFWPQKTPDFQTLSRIFFR